jgi:hypothetical protein
MALNAFRMDGAQFVIIACGACVLSGCFIWLAKCLLRKCRFSSKAQSGREDAPPSGPPGSVTGTRQDDGSERSVRIIGGGKNRSFARLDEEREHDDSNVLRVAPTEESVELTGAARTSTAD